MKQKICICGGHVTPAVALMDELSTHREIELVFVGRRYAAEYQLITEKGIRFLPIIAGKLPRYVSLSSFVALIKTPIGFVQAFLYCFRERPSLVVSFGGYVALPVAIVSWMMRIPVVTHEQTLVPGLTNRIIARLARHIYVAFEETVRLFPKQKTTYIGLPMRSDIFVAPKNPPFDIDEKKYPLLYITGGSQGAQALNEAIVPIINTLTATYTVIHQTGGTTIAPSARYLVKQYISSSELSWILQHAKIVIGRSGANTTIELAALGKVAIFVPLPWAAGNEQFLNAKWLVSRGGAVMCEQKDLSPEKLLRILTQVEKGYAPLHAKALKFTPQVPRDGAKRLADGVLSILAPTV